MIHSLRRSPKPTLDGTTHRFGTVPRSSAHAKDGLRGALGVPCFERGIPDSLSSTFAVRLLAVSLGMSAACATTPPGRYGVDTLNIRGTKHVDDRALMACLATQNREHLSINFGLSGSTECNEPPFDSNHWTLRLWRWPWSSWPVYDRTVLERDLVRIERWYRARGYYNARVIEAEFHPAEASQSDRIRESDLPACRQVRGGGCRLDIEITVEEGTPVRIRSIDVTGDEFLPPKLQRRLRSRIQFQIGDPFDEALHDRSKQLMVETLRRISRACALITAEVRIDNENATAELHYRVRPGPKTIVGTVSIEQQSEQATSESDRRRMEAPILGAADLRAGEDYSQDAIVEGQAAVYALGAFASVVVEAQVNESTCGIQYENDDEGIPQTSVAEDWDDQTVSIPITIQVQQGRKIRGGIGAGITAGTVNRGATTQQQDSIPQWDTHLIGTLKLRNRWLGQLTLEDRPRLIFKERFPEVDEAFAIGNTARISFRQPWRTFPRNIFISQIEYDVGPDDYNLYSRHVFDGSFGIERSF
ncbi:MAG: POTRA domain-containing protein, partial [Myxococcota bacterium]